MDDPFDRLEIAAERVALRAESNTRRVRYETGNRLGLLWVHAVVALLAGWQMFAWGTANQIEVAVGPHSRLVMGPLALAGGAVLAIGLTRHPRNIALEAVGLSLIACWDLLMTVGLAYARWAQHDFRIVGINTPLPVGYVPAYPIAVYAGLFALLVIHLWTLRHLRRQDKPDDKDGGEPDGDGSE